MLSTSSVKGNQAIVELHSLATAKNGMRFDNHYCWILYFRHELIVRVRAYLDSAMVARLFEENPLEMQSGTRGALTALIRTPLNEAGGEANGFSRTND